MDLKKTTLTLGGGTPAPLSKYSTNHGAAKQKGAGGGQTPRSTDSMADGTTQGNFRPDPPAMHQQAPGPDPQQVGCEAAQSAFESNNQ